MSFTGPGRASTPSLSSRPERQVPVSLVPVITLVVVAVLVHIALSVVIAPPPIVDQYGTALPYNFKSERGTNTLLSMAMFLLAACLAARALLLVWGKGGRTRLLWLAFTVIMAYFSADEVLQFHEHGGDFLDAHFSSGPFRNYNDLVVIVYGVALLPLALLLWREVLQHPRLLTMLVITGVLYVATSSVDTLVEYPSPVSVVIEEGIKIFCSTFFALSMLTGLVAVRWRQALEAPAAPSVRSTSSGTDQRGGSTSAVLVIWGGIVALMCYIGLLVAIVGKPGLRLPLTWLAVLALAAAVVKVLPRLDGLAGPFGGLRLLRIRSGRGGA
jgi:hypothetical protein